MIDDDYDGQWFPDICLTIEEKNLNQENWPDRETNPCPLATLLPLDPGP